VILPGKRIKPIPIKNLFLTMVMKRLVAQSRRMAVCLWRHLIAHWLLQQMEHPRFGDSLSTVLYIQFAIDVQNVFLDRVHTQD
jgi:hypothetical protein